MATVSETIDGVHVTSQVGDKRHRDRFQVADAPVHVVEVENRNGDECWVEVEISTRSSAVLIEGRRSWRSIRMKHGGVRSRGKRDWPYQPGLSFTGADPGHPQLLDVNVYKAGIWWPESRALPLLGKLTHTIWVG